LFIKLLVLMKNILTKPRSIIGATAWGAMVAIVIFVGLIAIDFIASMYRENFGPARQVESIAVGSGYSIAIEATPAHPILAEYEQSLAIYGGTPRRGGLLGRIELPMNTGGKIRVGVLVSNKISSPEIILVDRHANTLIRLAEVQASNIKEWNHLEYKALGIISGSSYPIKFIPCSIWSSLFEEERHEIYPPGYDEKSVCEEY
jgi:hypothetical protein